MNRRIALAAILSALPALHAADALPTAEAVMDRYLEVTGGKEAYQKRKSEILTGTLDFAAQGLKGKIQRYSAEGDKYYTTLDITGIGTVEMGVTNGVAWEKNAITGPRIKSGEERAQALLESAFNSSLRWRERFPKAEVAGVETVDGEECYKVVLTPAEGHPLTMYFQKKSGLEVKTTLVASSPLGDVPVSITASDYKNFNGVLVASKSTQKAGPQEFTITIDSIQLNPEIPPERFALPAEIKALAAKAARK